MGSPAGPTPTTIVLVGDAADCLPAERALAALASPPRVAGVVLTDAGPYRGSAPVLGSADDLSRLAPKPDLGLVCESTDGARTDAARAACEAAGVPVRTFPSLSCLLRPGPARATIELPPPREIDMVALVGRSPHPIDERLVRGFIAGKRVLITGAGGSIGSEIARRVASYGPAFLGLMERSENALFEIDRQVGARHPGLARQAILHDVVDADATLRRLVTLRPDVVFHAAAHKHVPMMEDHPAAAVNNNVFGTKSIADASLAVGVERFVMISTDKAVNPSSVMGATKRMAELYVQSLNAGRAAARARDRFCMVRFGNVLGSACSVLPIWAHQIAEGGPVTVTDPRMTRYFMTIPEAAALVIEAGALDPAALDGADVFVLDMGDPVRIYDLAQRFIRAHGLKPALVGAGPDAEIAPAGGGMMPVVCTGARPGEKLHEELVHRPEDLRPTPAPGVLAWTGPAAEPREVTAMIADLSGVRNSADDRAVLDVIARWTPGMRDRAVQVPGREPRVVGGMVGVA